MEKEKNAKLKAEAAEKEAKSNINNVTLTNRLGKPLYFYKDCKLPLQS